MAYSLKVECWKIIFVAGIKQASPASSYLVPVLEKRIEPDSAGIAADMRLGHPVVG